MSDYLESIYSSQLCIRLFCQIHACADLGSHQLFLVRCSLSWIVAMGLPSTKLPAFLISLAIFEMSFSFMVDFDPLCKKGLLETGEG